MTSSGTNHNEKDPPYRGKVALWTVPNLLCYARLAGAAGLVAVALADEGVPFLCLFLILAATDWLDGKLAVWLNQRSAFGARLDSAADAAMYGAFFLGCAWLKTEVLLSEMPWIAVALLAYAVSCSAAAIKFRRIPSYHTRTAKTAWLAVVVAAMALFLSEAIWPLRIAMLAVTIANIEAILVTALLDHWRADVPSVFHLPRCR